MSGTFRSVARLSAFATAIATTVCLCAANADGRASTIIPQVSRAQMIDTAKQMAEHRWIVKAANRKASCSSGYHSRFRDDEVVTGVAYDWGGMDDIAQFDAKLAAQQAAGSHKEDGVTDCTAGIDCSGLVSLCWRQPEKYGTTTIGAVATKLNVNVFTDLKPGDALNKPGSHIVMFAGFNADGSIDVYEASGSASRVVLTPRNTWTRFKDYVPIRYNGIVE